jgi:hypothetical protein
MGTKKKSPDELQKFSGEQANETFNELITTGNSKAGLSYEEAFEVMEKCPDEVLTSVGGAEYFSFDAKDKGKTFGFICERTDGTATIQDKTFDVVHIRGKAGDLFINGDKLLVKACKELKQLPVYIRVTYVDDVRNATGVYKKLDVKTFPVKEA